MGNDIPVATFEEAWKNHCNEDIHTPMGWFRWQWKGLAYTRRYQWCLHHSACTAFAILSLQLADESLLRRSSGLCRLQRWRLVRPRARPQRCPVLRVRQLHAAQLLLLGRRDPHPGWVGVQGSRQKCFYSQQLKPVKERLGGFWLIFVMIEKHDTSEVMFFACRCDSGWWLNFYRWQLFFYQTNHGD